MEEIKEGELPQNVFSVMCRHMLQEGYVKLPQRPQPPQADYQSGHEKPHAEPCG